jgi:dTDP-4-dehydrorhamnose reductase
MNILITGSNGQLGSELNRILKSYQTAFGGIPKEYDNCNITLANHSILDISNFKAVEEYFSINKFDVVINCAACTNVDGCEVDKDTAFKVNTLGAKHIAQICEKYDMKLVHVSTDYVFSGNATCPYCEYDLKNPQSIYGLTKHMGEEYVREFCSRYFIVRTSWLYGNTGNNFVKTIIKLAKQHGQLKVVNDQRGNPTNCHDLAYHILKIAITEHYGIYHCTGNGECTWYDFACKIIQYSGISCQVDPCTTDEFPRPARRPSYSSLDNMMLRLTVGDEMRNWQDALKEFISNINIESL